jgi:serine phosphatase RsbU (regulator of sigma subunit)
MRTGARAVLTSRNTLGSALASLDRIVRRHARERRDDDLAAAMLLIALDPHNDELLLAGAGQLHAAIVDGAGAAHPIHGHAVALGTGIDGPVDIQRLRLRRDDAIVAATVPMPAGWWDAPHRSAETLVAHAGVPEASALLVLPG